MKNWRYLTIIDAVVFLLAVNQARAASLPLSTDDMVAAAEHILLATVEKIVQPDPNRYRLEVQLRVSEALKGEVKENRFAFELVGGVVRGVGLFCSEDPQLAVGQPVILFLQSRRFPQAPVVGGAQGCLHVEKGKVVEKGTGLEDFLATVRNKVREEAEKTRPEKEGGQP